MLSDYQRAFNHSSLFPNNSFIEYVYSECLSAPATRYVYEISVVRSGVENNLCHLRAGRRPWKLPAKETNTAIQPPTLAIVRGELQCQICPNGYKLRPSWTETSTWQTNSIFMTLDLCFVCKDMKCEHNVRAKGQMSEGTHSVPISPSSHNRIVITERHIDNQYQKHQKNGVKLVLLWGNIQIKREGEGKSFVLNIFIVIVSHTASHRCLEFHAFMMSITRK